MSSAVDIVMRPASPPHGTKRFEKDDLNGVASATKKLCIRVFQEIASSPCFDRTALETPPPPQSPRSPSNASPIRGPGRDSYPRPQPLPQRRHSV